MENKNECSNNAKVTKKLPPARSPFVIIIRNISISTSSL